MPKENKKNKRKRKVISLETKIQILDRLNKGQRVSVVASRYSMNEATIRTIRSNEEAIKKSVASASSSGISTTSYVRNVVMENMEKALMLWIDDCAQNHTEIDSTLIKSKALMLYDSCKHKIETTSPNKKKTFSASSGWFERFKQRNYLHNYQLKGEQSSSKLIATQHSPPKFIDNSYTPHQAFHTGESGLIPQKKRKQTDQLKHRKSVNGHKVATSLRIEGKGFDDCVDLCAPELIIDAKPDENDLDRMLTGKSDNRSYLVEADRQPLAFTAKVIRNGLDLGRKLGDYFVHNDPKIERAILFQQDINRCLAQYVEIYKNQGQKLITDYFKKTLW